MKELSDDHVDILVLLLPPRAEEAEMLPYLHTYALHTGTQTVSGHGKVTGEWRSWGEGKRGKVRGREEEREEGWRERK